MADRKKRIFDIIQIGYDEDWVSRLFDFTLIALIFINLFIAFYSTFDSSEPYTDVLNALEAITVVAFTVEYALRVWTAEYLYKGLGPKRAALRYILSLTGIIDLLAFLPFYLPFFFPAGAVAFRMFRVARIFRIFRINAYYDSLNVIAEVLRNKRNQLLSSIFIIIVLMMGSSLCMYSLEHEAQPEAFNNAFSGFWWAVSTLLTVGYGDIYPVTVIGKIFGIIITFLGVGMVAIPTGILSAGFVEQYSKVKNLSDYAREADIRFVRLEVGDRHPWMDKKVKDLPLPPGLLLAVIQRDNDIVVPRGDTVIRKGDDVILGAEGYQDDAEIQLHEMVLRAHHPWVNQKIRDLDISRQTLIVMLRREGNLLMPNGSVTLREGDTLLLYTKRTYKGMQTVEV